ncbi:unnamed protein product [Rotaria sp. Silwood1]|nr:unnamed protein product [Rotaria sp. Silwood1]
MSFSPSLTSPVSEASQAEANTRTRNDSRQEQEENDHYQSASSEIIATCIEPTFSVSSSNQQQLHVPFQVRMTPPIVNMSCLQPILQVIPTRIFCELFSRNVISTVDLSCPLDLKRISLQVRNAEYNPKRFAAVIMRIRRPRTTALIFASGKMVCTGAKREEDSLEAARRYARVIQKLAFPVKFRDFKIQNMVGSIDVKFPIRFEKIILEHYQYCSYEPEIFPGLIYRIVKPKVALLIFVSGKIVLTGAKVRRDMHEAFEQIYPILKQCRK